jgi:hypothetical protein
MKLIEKEFWFARVNADFPITEEIEEGFPLNIGSLRITSKDGERNFVLDAYETDCVNGIKVDSRFEFSSKLEIDLDSFPSQEEEEDSEFNYELTVEDLKDCTAIFFCSKCDMEVGDIDFENGEIVVSFHFDDETEDIDIKLELEG